MPAVTPVETPATDELREFYERIERTSSGLGVPHVVCADRRAGQQLAENRSKLQPWTEGSHRQAFL